LGCSGEAKIITENFGNPMSNLKKYYILDPHEALQPRSNIKNIANNVE
jgi:hypothetical protein